MKHLLFTLSILLHSSLAYSQNYKNEDFYGRWLIGNDTITCSSGAHFIESNKGQTVTFFKDGSVKCSDDSDEIFGMLQNWSTNNQYLFTRNKSGRNNNYTPIILKDKIYFSVGTERAACGKADKYGSLNRKITRDATAKRIDLIGETEVVEAKNVDKRPVFKGGESQMIKWLTEHLVVPKTASDKPIPGKITILLVINKSGKVVKPHIWGKDLSSELAKEFEKIVMTMPSWTPGKIENVPVNTSVFIPFDLQAAGK